MEKICDVTIAHLNVYLYGMKGSVESYELIDLDLYNILFLPHWISQT